ncbi:MAG: DUF262 domain-containing protein [Gammaproteobacteria bacterium]
MTFEVKPIMNIEALFTSGHDSFFQIPEYQRLYKWNKDEINELWSDLYQAFTDDKDNYFLGSIITAENREDRYRDIVDGQQRITTLMILFCVIRDEYPDFNISTELKKEVTSDTIKDSIKHRANNRIRFRTDDDSQSDFESYIINDGATKKITKLPTMKELRKENSKYKFMQTAFMFRKLLKEKLSSTEERFKFFNFLFQKVQVIRIDCKDVNSAITLFQVINTRGLDLETSDLIKSFLIAQIAPSENEKKNQFKADWNSTKQNADDSEIKLDVLINIYQYYALVKEQGKNLYENLKRFFQGGYEGTTPPENSNKAISEIKKFSEYHKDVHGAKDKYVYLLRNTPWPTL